MKFESVDLGPAYEHSPYGIGLHSLSLTTPSPVLIDLRILHGFHYT